MKIHEGIRGGVSRDMPFLREPEDQQVFMSAEGGSNSEFSGEPRSQNEGR